LTCPIALRQHVLEREGRRQQVPLVEPPAGVGEGAACERVAVPELGLEVRHEIVVDHQHRGDDRHDPLDQSLDEPGALGLDEVAHLGA
jgi:hypothetical protein